MYLMLYYLDKRDKTRVEKRTVGDVHGGVAECSAVYRFFVNEVRRNAELAHIEITSMSTVPQWNGEVDEVFTREDIMGCKAVLGEV